MFVENHIIQCFVLFINCYVHERTYRFRVTVILTVNYAFSFVFAVDRNEVYRTVQRNANNVKTKVESFVRVIVGEQTDQSRELRSNTLVIADRHFITCFARSSLFNTITLKNNVPINIIIN